MKCTSEEQRIAARYRRFGITADIVNIIVNDGIQKGMTRKAALIGVRYALSKAYNQHEYFTSQDVAEITGESVEEVNQHIAQLGIAEITIATDIKQ